MSSHPPEAPAISPNVVPDQPSVTRKLPVLKSKQRISKRPLLHPAIAPPRSASSTPKVVYVSSKSSFVATVKRVRSLLNHVEKRSLGPQANSLLRKDPRTVLKTISSAVRDDIGKEKRDEEVIMKASGKAIEMGLRLAAWCSAQEDIKLELRTGSVGAIDDIVDEEGFEESSRMRNVSYLDVCVRLV